MRLRAIDPFLTLPLALWMSAGCAGSSASSEPPRSSATTSTQPDDAAAAPSDATAATANAATDASTAAEPAATAPDAAVAPNAPEPVDSATAQAPCFGWNASRHVALCAVGTWENHGEGTLLAFVEIPGGTSHGALRVEPAQSTDGSVMRVLEPSAREELRTAFGAGGFAPMPPLSCTPITNRGSVTATGTTISFRRVSRSTSRGGENQAPRFTHRIEARFGPRAPFVLVGQVENAPVAEPEARVCPLPGDGYVLVTAAWSYADEGEYHTEGEAWICDRATGRCAGPPRP